MSLQIIVDGKDQFVMFRHTIFVAGVGVGKESIGTSPEEGNSGRYYYKREIFAGAP